MVFGHIALYLEQEIEPEVEQEILERKKAETGGRSPHTQIHARSFSPSSFRI